MSALDAFLPGLIDDCDDIGTTPANSLDPDLRNAFQRQALILCTLLEMRASSTLIGIAIGRLEALVVNQGEAFAHGLDVARGMVADVQAARQEGRWPSGSAVE